MSERIFSETLKDVVALMGRLDEATKDQGSESHWVASATLTVKGDGFKVGALIYEDDQWIFVPEYVEET